MIITMPQIFQLVFIGVIGLIIGSFLGSLTWRMGSKFKVQSSKFKVLARSICPRCGKQIRWYDNIPLFSFILLGGKCRMCGKPISWRYPIIELLTAATFVLLAWMDITNISVLMIWWKGWLGPFMLPFFLTIASFLIALVVIDLEEQLLPDQLIFPAVILVLIFLIPSPSPTFFLHFLWASIGATVILVLHAITFGRGMGLGDVKLLFLLGLLTGVSLPVAFFLAVFIGAVVGILLVVLKLAHFGKPIPFGPFLIFAVLLTALFEDKIWALLAGGR